MQFWALRKLRIKEEKGFVTTQKNNLKKKRNRWKQNVKIRLCITCDRSHRLQLVYKKRKQDQPCFQVSLPLPWSSAPGAWMVNKSTTINQRKNPVISIVWTLIKPPHPLLMEQSLWNRGTYFGRSLPPPPPTPGRGFPCSFSLHCPLRKARCLLEQG